MQDLDIIAMSSIGIDSLSGCFKLFLLNVAKFGSSSEPANCLCKFVIVGFVLGPLNLTLGDAFSCMKITNLSLMKGKGKHNTPSVLLYKA